MLLPSLLVGKLASLPSTRRHLCSCCNDNSCSHHDGIVAIVDAQACLQHCQASVVALVTCGQAGVFSHVTMTLLPSMHRVFVVVTIVIVALMMMASLPVLMCRCPCHRQNGVVTLGTMALLPLILNSIVTLVAMVSSLSSSWCCWPLHNGVVIIIDVQASLLSLQWCCCHRCNGVVAIDVQASLLLLQWGL